MDELLSELLAAFETEKVGRIYDLLDMFWARLALHIRAEHLHLFPAILNRFGLNNQPLKTNIPKFEKVKSAIAKLQDDHNFFMRELVAAIKQMRDLREMNSPDTIDRLREVRKTIIAVKSRLETHNQLEETQIYNWADALFQTAERDALNEQMANELENLPPRFS